jgi:adenylylsulfate kinase
METTEERQEGFALWLTGRPGPGKSTVARLLGDALRARGHAVELLDGQSEHAALDGRTLPSALLRSKPAAERGAVAIVSTASPSQATRAEARRGVERLVEVYVTDAPASPVPPRADAGSVEATVAVGHEPAASRPDVPPAPDVVIESGRESPDEIAKRVLGTLERLGYLRVVRPIGETGYTEEEEAQVKERLEALGYL